jgi:hypothetical protein
MIYHTIRNSGRISRFAGLALVSTWILQPSFAQAFEGRINATVTQGNQTEALRYTAGTNFLRVEMTAISRPNPVDILDRTSGMLTLLFPHNRSFVRLQPLMGTSTLPPGFPQTPGALPPGIGPQTQPIGVPVRPNLPPSPGMLGNSLPGIGPTNLPGIPAPPHLPVIPDRPAMPATPSGLPLGIGPQASAPNPPGVPAIRQMPAMPNMGRAGGMPVMPMIPMMGEAVELKATGDKTNLLGFACEKFEIQQRGETMEIWATDQLLPFQYYIRNQPRRFGPQKIEDKWGDALRAKKLFPLLAVLKSGGGGERLRFEVKSITPEEIADQDGTLFQPPVGYQEIQPLPF